MMMMLIIIIIIIIIIYVDSMTDHLGPFGLGISVDIWLDSLDGRSAHRRSS
jgi:hypothetical protein